MKKVNSDCVFCSYNLLIIVVISGSTIAILNIRLMLMKLSEIIQKHLERHEEILLTDMICMRMTMMVKAMRMILTR